MDERKTSCFQKDGKHSGNGDHSKYYMSEVFSVDTDYILGTGCYLMDERKMGCFQKDGKGILTTQ